MQLHELQPNAKRLRSKRIGRGGARGKTSGRGTKGQKARAGHRIRPDVRDTIKKIPKLRGRGKHLFKSFRSKPLPVNVASLERVFESGEHVTPKVLVERNVVRRRAGMLPAVKLLGNGKLTKKLTVAGCDVSRSARVHIEEAGGSVD